MTVHCDYCKTDSVSVHTNCPNCGAPIVQAADSEFDTTQATYKVTCRYGSHWTDPRATFGINTSGKLSNDETVSDVLKRYGAEYAVPLGVME